PLDGVVGAAEQGDKGAKGTTQAQPPDDSIYNKPGLDFWRAVSLETGVFGWFGKANVPNLPYLNANGVNYDPNNPSTFNKDYFSRIGVDARLKYFDLDVYGACFWGDDPFPGYLQDMITPAGDTKQFGFFIEADYMVNPWIMTFLRYEQVKIFNSGLATFSPGISGGEEARLVPGVTFAIRQNLRLSSEVYIDLQNVPLATGYPEATDQWITSLQFAF
ncbi:MAG: hypothetical protein ABSG53_25725, partial [Thermoguttaceae bacterium]